MQPVPIKMIFNNINGCPHGLAAGACPVCSGMGGGGSAKRKNEMTWDECYAIGQMLKSAKKTAEQNKLNNELMVPALMQNGLAVMIVLKMAVVKSFIQNKLFMPVTNLLNSLKQALAKELAPIITALSNLTAKLTESFKQLADKFTNIMDKLAAVFGEKEKALRENLEKGLNKLKKKIFSFFEAVDTSMDQGEQEENHPDEDYENE